jgi:ABC-type multidrug transport system ATPase subunit/pSer/pThr/pTyr-binding forkhead associated (FHA) protein
LPFEQHSANYFPQQLASARCGTESRSEAPEVTQKLAAPVLEIRTPNGVAKHELGAASYRLGRHPDNDIVVDSPIVSRVHLVFDRCTGGYRVRDHSRNGTWLGGRRITSLGLTELVEFHIGDHPTERIALRYVPAATLSSKAGRFRSLVLEGNGPFSIGRGQENALVLDDPACSGQHAQLMRVGDAWSLRDLGAANGTFLNGARVAEALLSVGDRVLCGNTALTYDGRRLISDDARGASIQVRDVTVVGERQQRLLDAISFVVWPGSFVSILGASGTGKSTLVNAMTGTRPVRSGDVLLNGLDVVHHRDAFRHAIGYVPQDDIVHPELTVLAALRYAARLRLPRDTSPSEAEHRIDAVLRDVGLAERRHAPIWRLSGGQRKRVSIAVEIIMRPPLLILDEPTSGLDPGLDRQMMTLLKGFASDGQTVLAVTHAVANIDLCDAVIFLADGGRLAFFGAPSEAREYFGTGDFAAIYYAVGNEHDPEWWQARFLGSPWHTSNIEARLPPSPAADLPGAARPRIAAAGSTQPGPSVGHFLPLTRRYLEIMLRDRGNLAFLLGQAPAIAVML